MFSDPVFGESFFGRQEIIDLLFKRANAFKSGYRQNVAVIGHRELGKTSLLRHFLHTYRDPAVLTVYVEIKFQALDYFVDQFIRSLLFEALTQSEPPPSLSPYESLAQLADRAVPYMPKTAARVKEITQSLKHRHAEDAYSKVLELTSVVKEETGKNCIVVLDEFHRLGEFGLKNAFSDFGKRIMIQKDTLYLLSSSSFTASRKILAEKLALLFGHFERIYLEPFDFETSFQFLETRLSPLQISRSLNYFLVAFTDGHPFFLQTITSRVRELTLAEGRAEVSREIIAEVLRRLLFDSQGVLYQYFLKLIAPWTGPQSRGSQVLVLTKLAHGINKLKDLALAVNRGQRDTSVYLQELVEHELILKTGVFYRFHNKIFKFWLREAYERKELSLQGMAGKAEDFTRRIYQMIGEYQELLAMDASDRLGDLLSRFNNDIVEWGEKKRKLPHFSEILKSKETGFGPSARSRNLIARGHGRCWVCKIVEEKATEREILELVNGTKEKGKAAPTKVLVALNGVDENAKLLAKEKKILTIGLARLNLLMDIYGRAPIIPSFSR
jgi:AAA+ ATPase superfamily predicted ATPase